MKLLVTGGAGFIGSHIADALIEKGHEVTIVDNLLMGRMENVPKAARFFLMDIRAAEIEKVFDLGRFDAVFHLAAQMDVRKSVEDPIFDAGVNVLGSLNLIRSAVRTGVKKVVFASTGGAVYGEQEVFPCDETHPTRPVSPYGITKLCVEKYLYYYALEFGLKYTVLRFANVYGPRQNPHGEAGVVAIFTSRLLSGGQPVINGDGRQTRDYVYVGDVVQANLKALTHPENDAFNVGTGIETDVNRIFDLLNRYTGGKASEQHGPAKPGEQMRSVISHRKIKDVLGWEPRVGLEEGLKRTVDYFRNR
ncbi:MAG: NAD-dependent epimerase/dehydratase family protein [bacterium]|nr:NAD-dependent epimerase/dehydratase family protein [bacterium]